MSSDNRSIMFRIGNKTFSVLDSEAKRKHVSLNTFVNQVLQKHLDWHTHAVKAGEVPIAKGLITSLMNRLDEEEFIKLAKESLRYP